MLENLEIKDWLKLNASLQKKKNQLRKDLKDRGVLQRNGKNKYDNYTYFSEAQYKELFTELLAYNGLELKFSEISYDTFEGSEKQSNGRMPKLVFSLIDIDTGFYEETVITGEGIDKGDKAGYKAYTGALKYYLADTFLVATGDDPEQDSPSEKMNTKTAKKSAPAKAEEALKATPLQVAHLAMVYTGENLQKLLKVNNIEKLEDLPFAKASAIIEKLKERENA